MLFIELNYLLELHEEIIEKSGGSLGIRDFGAIESALAQQQISFGGLDVYPDLETKASSLCFSLVCNHAFIDGNKRIGHAAMETFLFINGYVLDSPTDEQESLILRLADGKVSREELTDWVRRHVAKL